jgi:hypothetical protein
MIIHPAPQRKQTFSEKLGLGLRQGLETASNEYDKYAENKAIKRLGLDVEGISDPQLRREIVANQLARGRAVDDSKKAANVDYSQKKPGLSTPNSQQRTQSSNPEVKDNIPTQRGNASPGFKQPAPRSNASPRFNENANQSNRNLEGVTPEPRNSGQIRPELNEEEILAAAQDTVNQKIAQGLPADLNEELNIFRSIENDKKLGNQQVEADREKRLALQEKYGVMGEGAYKTYFGENADPEHLAWFGRKGEAYALEGKTDSEIKQLLAKDARKLKNDIKKIENTIGPLRSVRSLLAQDSRKQERKYQDINIKLQPLLKEGLYNDARNLLEGIGYQPEEREQIITKGLGENTNKVLVKMPPVKKIEKASLLQSGKIQKDENGKKHIVPAGMELKKGEVVNQTLPEEDVNIFQDNLRNVFKADPKTNLLLLRKAYEEKGIDWQTFKNGLNDLIESGEVNLDEDQDEFLDLLETPPLSRLGELLHGLGLQGR